MAQRIGLSVLIVAGIAMPALAQMNFPGRMPGDVPYAHEYGPNAPGQPPVIPPPPLPSPNPIRPPEQSLGYQPVRPAPKSENRVPERHAIPPERLPPRGTDRKERGRLIEVPGPRILER